MNQDRATPEVGDAAFDALLGHLKREHAFDFTVYKRPGLMRRLRKRMAQVGISGFERYRHYLASQPDEYFRLFDAVLVNATGFFRDPEAWDALGARVLPHLGGADTIRVWSAGCSTGEEAYSLVMLLAEQMGRDEVRDRVVVYATDVDGAALRQARAAVYDARAVESLPSRLLDRYFERVGDRFAFAPELRCCVIFGHNDLTRDAPISRLRLLICRNTLMYFDASVQSRILSRFHAAMDDGGFLFLGRAEMLPTRRSDLFMPVDLRSRLFVRMPEIAPTAGSLPSPVARDARLTELDETAEALATVREELSTTAEALRSAVEQLETADQEIHSTNEEMRAISDELRLRTEQLQWTNRCMRSLLAGSRVAVVLDAQLCVRLWTERAERMWGLHRDEAEGRAFLELGLGIPADQLRDLDEILIMEEAPSAEPDA